MFVHPDGVNPSSSGMSWLFTTATNRTEKGVEVVGIYFEDNPWGSLGVFDWSCSPKHPCAGGEPGPSWIWTSFFTAFQCNLIEDVDSGGHQQTVMQYVNQTRKLDNASPPLWRNAVYLWNTCAGVWDLVYEHEYRTNQRNCSIDSRCGWWGPILETFSASLPEIDELGFEDSLLLHDGAWSELRPDETDFVGPTLPWKLFHLDPNRGYGVGNRVVVVVAVDIKPGSDRNPVNLRSKGNIPVVILTSDKFDATQVNLETVRFGPSGATERHQRVHVKDADYDGDMDVVLHFKSIDTGILCGDTKATLMGETFSGEEFTGSDVIKIVKCPKNKKNKKKRR
jgi:hypothetical protein